MKKRDQDIRLGGVYPKQKTPCQTKLYLTKRLYFYLNLNRTFQKFHQHAYGLIYSQRVLLKLIDEAGLSREKAYDMVQKLANKSWQEQTSFRKLVEDSEIMTSSQYLLQLMQ